MRILDRYTLKPVVKIFISCVFIFLFLYIIIDVLTRLEDLMKLKIPIYILAQYYLLNLPVMFVQVSPFACLLSTLYSFGKLNQDNEIIAMRSSGLSVFQITKTTIVFGVIISIFVFYVNNAVISRSQAKLVNIREQMDYGAGRANQKRQEVINNLSMYGIKNRLFFINRYFAATNTMEGITILEHDEHQNLIKKIVANKGIYSDGLWKFYQCITYNFDKNGQVIQEPTYFEEEIMSIPEKPGDFQNQRQRPDFMTIPQLEDYIWRLSKSGASSVIRNLKVDLYQRFAAPFTNLIIILLGIPFSLIMRRKATGLSSIGVSILVGFLYYIFDAISIALGKGGILPPILSASLSHIIGLSAGIYFIKTLP
ncbi:MAG: LptF/LptG family permease [Candidatus Omnitrophica bacterium]|nr:LptF/LptG family permease [Candidatus Omnitrophota bacterium]